VSDTFVVDPPHVGEQVVGPTKTVTVNIINPITGAVIRSFGMDVVNAPRTALFVNGFHGSSTYPLTAGDSVVNIYFQGVNNWVSIT
jgi:hypothetical protein